MDKDEQEEAKERIVNMTQAAAELTRALGLPPEDMFEVLHMVYSDRFQPEAREISDVRESMAGHRKKPPQSGGAAKIVTIGSRVTLRARDGETWKFRLVGSYQPLSKVRSYAGYKLTTYYPISYESPVGEALMGHKVGDRVRVPLLGREKSMKEFIILDINYQ